MNSKNLILSSSGLKNLILNNFGSENEFKFVFGNHEIKFHKIVAEFLSPIVSHLHNCDPTIDLISYDDQYNKLKHFSQFNDPISDKIITQLIKLSKGSPIEISESDSNGYRIISFILGNEELYNKINELYPIVTKPENIDKMITELQIFYLFDQNYGKFQCSSIIDYFSLNFSKIDRKKLLNLPETVIYSIIYNEKLKIDDQDSFYDFLFEFISNSKDEEDNEKFSLFEKVDFTNLSPQKFSEFLTNFKLSQMTETLWQKICQCFIIKQFQIDKTENLNNNSGQVFKFDGNPDHRFEGIIQYLTKKAKGNVSDKNVVNVTSSSTIDAGYLPSNAVDFSSEHYFESKNQSNQWLLFDFKENKVQPTHYSIRSRTDNDFYNLQSWCIEVSNTNNGNDWKIIDSRNNENGLKGKNQSETYSIQTKLAQNESYRFLRIRQTGKSTRDGNYLVITSLEWFGTLI